MIPPTLKLSIIIPAHNEEDHIRFALESALLQRVNFEFEVLVIDDGSSDGTSRVVEDFQTRFDNLRLVRNEQNRGKGASFRTAYGMARGEYFHVLDGDDYFISYDKLQRQVDALDSMPNVCAVAHNCLIVYEDNTLEVLNNQLRAFDASYDNMINFWYYFHTSTYMFRKLVNELPVEFETARGLRGDSACLYFHVFTSKLGIHYLSGVMSVYDYHGQGLWSGVSTAEKSNVNVDVYSHIRDYIVRDPQSVEYAILNNQIEVIKETALSSSDARQRPGGRLTSNEVFRACYAVASRIFRPEVYDKLFRGMHFLGLIDQLCEAMGRLALVQAGYPMLDRIYDDNKVAFLVSGLQPKGGGIYGEIVDLIDIHLNAGHHVLLVVSGIAASDMPNITRLIEEPRVDLQFVKAPTWPEHVWAIIDMLYKAAPYRLYPYISHHDVANCAAVQKGLAREIVLNYVYDHGSSLGITNSAIDKVVFKSARQMESVMGVVPRDKCMLIPSLYKSVFASNPYQPLRKSTLTTASAAARAYKVEMSGDIEYCDVVVNILQRTQGQHIHFGPLSEAYLERIQQGLLVAGLEPEQFVHIAFAEQFSQALNNLGVDLFITPFPVASAKIGIEVMSCGIPLIYYKAEKSALFDAIDFGDPDQWSWTTATELYSIIATITKEQLIQKSHSARAHFERTNDFSQHSFRPLELAGQAYPAHVAPALPFDDIITKRLYPVDELLEMLLRGHVNNGGERAI